MDLHTWLLITRARMLSGVMRRIVRRRLRTASPDKSQRIEQMFAETEAMRRDSKTLIKRIDDLEHFNGIEVAESMLDFNRKYAPELVESSHQHLETMRKTEAESTHLQELKKSAGEDREKAVALAREYCESHPYSRLGQAHLMGALTKAGLIDEAIALCHPDDTPRGQYSYHQTLGNLLLKKQDWNGAIEQAKLAQKFEKVNTDREMRQLMSIPPQILIASALAGKGDRAKASKLFDRCLRATSDKKMREAIQKSRTEAGL
ncbi:MAG: hypothetical protein QM758_21435 [Armatimonas sp.]